MLLELCLLDAVFGPDLDRTLQFLVLIQQECGRGLDVFDFLLLMDANGAFARDLRRLVYCFTFGHAFLLLLRTLDIFVWIIL